MAPQKARKPFDSFRVSGTTYGFTARTELIEVRSIILWELLLSHPPDFFVNLSNINYAASSSYHIGKPMSADDR